MQQQQQQLAAAAAALPLAKVFVYTRDEYDLIDDWLTYHGALFGPENLVVVDNGSADERVLRAYEAHAARGVTVVREPRNISGFSEVMSEHMQRYRGAARFLVPLDTDEFVVRAPGGAGDDDRPLSAAELRELMDGAQADAPDATVFRFADLLAAVVQPEPGAGYARQHHARPAAQMTRFEDQGWDKVYFAAAPFVRTHAGNHSGAAAHGRQAPSPRLALLHYHNTGARRQLERCRVSLLGYGHMTPAQLALPEAEQLALCRALLAQHLRGGHRVAQYAGVLKRAAVVRAFHRATGRLPSPQFVADVTALGGEASADAALDSVRYNPKAPADFADPAALPAEEDVVLYDEPGRAERARYRVTQVARLLLLG